MKRWDLEKERAKYGQADSWASEMLSVQSVRRHSQDPSSSSCSPTPTPLVAPGVNFPKLLFLLHHWTRPRGRIWEDWQRKLIIYHRMHHWKVILCLLTRPAPKSRGRLKGSNSCPQGYILLRPCPRWSSVQAHLVASYWEVFCLFVFYLFSIHP